VLWEIQVGPFLRFRCRVGHAWAAEALVQEQGKSIEAAMWMALRALEDRASLNEKLAAQAEAQGRQWGAERHREDLAAMRDSIDTLRRLLGHQPAGFEELDQPGSDS
jgi:two-component system chemotaxis response regulator CheB